MNRNSTVTKIAEPARTASRARRPEASHEDPLAWELLGHLIHDIPDGPAPPLDLLLARCSSL